MFGKKKMLTYSDEEMNSLIEDSSEKEETRRIVSGLLTPPSLGDHKEVSNRLLIGLVAVIIISNGLVIYSVAMGWI